MIEQATSLNQPQWSAARDRRQTSSTPDRFRARQVLNA